MKEIIKILNCPICGSQVRLSVKTKPFRAGFENGERTIEVVYDIGKPCCQVYGRKLLHYFDNKGSNFNNPTGSDF